MGLLGAYAILREANLKFVNNAQPENITLDQIVKWINAPQSNKGCLFDFQLSSTLRKVLINRFNMNHDSFKNNAITSNKIKEAVLKHLDNVKSELLQVITV